VHVQADQLEAAAADLGERLAELGVPDAVLAVRAAGVGLVAVAVAKPRVEPQPDPVAGRSSTSAVNTSASGSPLVTVYPAASARSISPSDTASTATPAARMRRSTWRLEFAFWANRITSNDLSCAIRARIVASS